MQLNSDDFDRLNQLSNDTSVTMREHIFTSRLLPHLVPRETGEDIQASKVPVDIWLAAAGNAYSTLEVVDNSGKVLFLVPPLLSRAPLPVPGREYSPSSDIEELAAIYSARISTEPPHVVNKWYLEQISRLNVNPEEVLRNLYALQWAVIYKRYNIPMTRLFGDKGEVVDERLSAAMKVAPGASSTTATSDTDTLYGLDDEATLL